MRAAEILKHLTKEDIDGLFADFLGEISDEYLQQQPYYCGDGLDLMRYCIFNLEGISVRIPKLKSMHGLYMRYISATLRMSPDISIEKLCYKTGLNEKTVRKYVREIQRVSQWKTSHS